VDGQTKQFKIKNIYLLFESKEGGYNKMLVSFSPGCLGCTGQKPSRCVQCQNFELDCMLPNLNTVALKEEEKLSAIRKEFKGLALQDSNDSQFKIQQGE